MVKTGHFEEKSDDNTSKKNEKRASRQKPQKGVVFVAVKDKSESESEEVGKVGTANPRRVAPHPRLHLTKCWS